MLARLADGNSLTTFQHRISWVDLAVQVQILHGRQHLLGGMSPAAGHHQSVHPALRPVILLASSRGRCPWPQLAACRWLRYWGALLVRNNELHTSFQETPLRPPLAGCCIGRQIHPHQLAASFAGQVDESPLLVGEAVVILPPDRGARSASSSTDRCGARCLVDQDFQPCWRAGEHRGDHVGEGLVVWKKPWRRAGRPYHHSHQVCSESNHPPPGRCGQARYRRSSPASSSSTTPSCSPSINRL